jgi:RNA polymerase sigma-70 factor (ECF subfamily)
VVRAAHLAETAVVLPFAGLGGHRRGATRVGEQGIRDQIERARAGDRDAFAELFRAYEADVTRLCARLLAAPTEAEDACGEVFLRAREGLEGFDPGRSFRSWILSIGAHLCIDRLRRRHVEAHLFESSDGTADFADAGSPTALDRVLQSEERRALLAAIDALPPRYRVPLVLRYFADLDYDAIAGALAVGRGQVGSLLFRARRLLRQRLLDGMVSEERP